MEIDRSVVGTIYNKYTNEILTRRTAPNGTMYKTYKQGARYLEIYKEEEGMSINGNIDKGYDVTKYKNNLGVLIEIDFNKGTNKMVIDCPDDGGVGRHYK